MEQHKIDATIRLEAESQEHVRIIVNDMMNFFLNHYPNNFLSMDGEIDRGSHDELPLERHPVL